MKKIIVTLTPEADDFIFNQVVEYIREEPFVQDVVVKDHVPDAGKKVTEIEQTIEKARKNKACDLAANFYAGSNYPNVQQITTHEVWELMADFAIEYAREKEREAFEAAKEVKPSGNFSDGHPVFDDVYVCFEDYTNRN